MHRAQTRSGRPPRAPERFPTPGSQSMSAHGGPPPAVGTPVPAAATPRKLAGKCWRLVENQLQSTSGRCQLIDPHRRLPDSRHLGWRSLRALRGTKKKTTVTGGWKSGFANWYNWRLQSGCRAGHPNGGGRTERQPLCPHNCSMLPLWHPTAVDCSGSHRLVATDTLAGDWSTQKRYVSRRRQRKDSSVAHVP